MNRTLLVWLSTMMTIASQGQSFTNLNFEAAHDLPSSGGSVATTDALPGWAAFNGTNQLSLIAYNGHGSEPVELVGDSYVIDGNFSVFLGSGCSISQTGLIPSDTQALYLEASASGVWKPLMKLMSPSEAKRCRWRAFTKLPLTLICGARIFRRLPARRQL
jgi:hypothetical protein